MSTQKATVGCQLPTRFDSYTRGLHLRNTDYLNWNGYGVAEPAGWVGMVELARLGTRAVSSLFEVERTT